MEFQYIDIICNNYSFFVDIKPNDFIKDLKSKILNQEGIPIEYQKLSFEGKLLEDQQTLSDYKIQKGSNINFEIKQKGSMQIQIKFQHDDLIMLQVDENDSIEYIRFKIFYNLGYQLAQQLYYQGIYLCDGFSLMDYNIQKDDIIYLTFSNEIKNPFGCQVQFEGRTFQSGGYKSKYVFNLKQEIYNNTSLHPYQQQLFYQGQELEDDQIIKNYNIKNESTLTLKRRQQQDQKVHQKICQLLEQNQSKDKEIKRCHIAIDGLKKKVIPDLRQQVKQYQKLIDEQSQQIQQLQKDIQKINPVFLEDKEKKEQFLAIKNKFDELQQVNYTNIKEFQQNYKENKYLGGGAYGYVESLQVINEEIKEKLKKDNQQLAVKKLKCNSYPKDQLEQEVLSLQQVQILPKMYRRFIIDLQKTYYNENKNQIYMIIPQARTSFYDDITERIKTQNHFKKEDLIYKFSCVLLGLKSLEVLSMLHRDIKPENMLIMEDESLVLADFGTTKQNRATLTIQVGTPRYYSPECVVLFGENQKLFEEKEEEHAQTVQQLRELKMNDLYGVGQTFIFAASLLKQPEQTFQKDWFKTYNGIRQKWYNEAFNKMYSEKKYSDAFIYLLQSMVDLDPKKRPSLQQCLDFLKECPGW